ncbi:MAG: hypothetical protein WD827_07180 [Solirubrobacterales bacterium]
MRLIPKSIHSPRAKLPRISISEEEILADLQYPASRRSDGKVEVASPARRRARR